MQQVKLKFAKAKNAETNKEEKGAKEKMKKTKTFGTVETLERERERESSILEK